MRLTYPVVAGVSSDTAVPTPVATVTTASLSRPDGLAVNRTTDSSAGTIRCTTAVPVLPPSPTPASTSATAAGRSARVTSSLVR